MTRGRAEIEVRGEQPEDESVIDTVTAQAFGSLKFPAQLARLGYHESACSPIAIGSLPE